MAAQSFATSDMQSLQVQQVCQSVVTAGQQSQATVQKVATTQAPQTFVVQKTVTLPSNNTSENYSGHGQKTVAITNNNQSQGTTILQPATQGYSTGQQFIVTIPRDHSNGESMQEVEIQQGTPSQVIYQPGHNQYVEPAASHTNHNHSVYAAPNGQIQNYSDYNPVYNPVTGTYYHATGSGQMTQLGGLQGQIVQGGTYLVSSAMDSDGQHITHTTRASPATDKDNSHQRSSHFDVKSWQREVQWLIDNYETAEGVSLPRSTLYNHYLRHCQEQKIDPMNPASFGKLIRSVFLGLRTRRLGTRGNSKYHYYGIRLQVDSPLNAMMDEAYAPIRSQPPIYRRGNSKYHYYGIRIKPDSPLNAFTDDHALPMRQQSMSSAKRFKNVGGSTDGKEVASTQAESMQFQNQQFLGDASGAIPSFGCVEIKADELPEGLTIEHIRIFEDLFKKHCEQILQTVVNLQFSEVEKIWQTFWRTTPTDLRQNADMVAEQRLAKEKLYAMSRLLAVRDFVRRSDYMYYQALVEVLIPDVLRPIPSSLTQAVRNFAKSLENWLKNAMTGVPDDMIKTKVSAVSAFAQTLRRYTSLNHLAQAARAVLQNTTQINQMLTDLNRVDFANVQEQASWVCQCEDGVVQQIQEDFKKTLQGQNSLEAWAIWLEGVVNQVLAPHEGGPNFAKAARQFLLKWSFYSSMVIRDLTLRSAASFGSFHLIRLLYDEYMFYLVEHKVAAATDESPIAVMGEVRHQSLDATGNFGSSEIDSKLTIHGAIINSTSRSSSLALNNTTLLNSVHAATTATAQPATVSSTPNLGLPSGTIHGTAVAASPKLSQVTTIHGSPKLGSISNLQAGNPTTVAVVASGAAGTGPKTIVVVPVSASTSGSGDAQPAVKRIKTT